MKRGLAGFVALCAVAVLFGGTARAHNPVVINGGPTNAETAHFIKDVSVSRVAYHHAKPGQELLWLTFDGKAGQTLDFQMGLPKLERYAGVRPATALLGSGLPAAPGLPFAVPEGMGALLFTTDGQTPTEFDEEFTGTLDWQFQGEQVQLPQDGKYFLVSYIPSGEEGKLWIAPGVKEAFGLWDLIRMPVIIVQARLFHEVFPWGGILGWAYLGLFLVAVAGVAGAGALLL